MPAEITRSVGQSTNPAMQNSGKSHGPMLARHSTLTRYCARQSAAVPLQVSGASQGPLMVLLQTVPAGL